MDSTFVDGHRVSGGPRHNEVFETSLHREVRKRQLAETPPEVRPSTPIKITKPWETESKSNREKREGRKNLPKKEGWYLDRTRLSGVDTREVQTWFGRYPSQQRL
jgi:hypothetical protein